MTLGDQLLDHTHPFLGGCVLPYQVPDAFKSFFMRLEDDDPILGTSEKIATTRQADFSTK